MNIPPSPSFIIQTEADKAASNNGYRIPLGVQDGWIGYRSTTAQGQIWIASVSDQGPWLLALDHSGVIDELGLEPEGYAGPGFARFAFATLRELYAVLPRVYQLACSLPDGPLRSFQSRVRELPVTTETERLVVQRIGQEIFRESLLGYWSGRCPLTGISDSELLRASHIIPWRECSSDAERLDVHNGLLLSALWDAAFDRGLVTFTDNGIPVFSPVLSQQALGQLNWTSPIPLTVAHIQKLKWHRAYLFSGYQFKQ